MVAAPAAFASACQKQAPEPPSLRATELAPAAESSRSVPAASAELAEGAPGPDVTFTLQDGFRLSLASLKGKFVLAAFCSSIESLACVREAQGLREHWNELHELHQVAIAFVTPEAAAVQRAFIAEQRLPFDFASDADGAIAQKFMLKTTADYGVRAFLVSREGNIRKSWLAANPDQQAREILAVVAD